jgi:hypothetical protein
MLSGMVSAYVLAKTLTSLRSRTMATYKFEIAVPVVNHLDQECIDYKDSVAQAFERCRIDTNEAIEIAQEEMTEWGAEVIRFKGAHISAEFVEFDSSNISHACGYFLVTLKGKWRVIHKLKRLHEKYWKEDADV